MPTRHLRPASQVRNRRKLVWSTTDVTVTLPAGQNSDTDLLADLATAGSSVLGATVMRTHVLLHVQNWALVADAMVWGLLVCRAADIGLNVVGQASANVHDLDWAISTALFPQSSGAAVSVAQTYPYDVKSRRKVQEMGQRYALCVSNNSAAAKTYDIFARTLIALP